MATNNPKIKQITSAGLNFGRGVTNKCLLIRGRGQTLAEGKKHPNNQKKKQLRKLTLERPTWSSISPIGPRIIDRRGLFYPPPEANPCRYSLPKLVQIFLPKLVQPKLFPPSQIKLKGHIPKIEIILLMICPSLCY